ncbi:unnamed protein product [Onchocerca flexuosa]|uniref:Uncharacterized protein n=1 Tax=Onchocerca flexuosa TaxID=387005 RepID=A0A183HYE8_9BILA|nr:unnamed protein product [Onchocerca flexuosa]
MTAFYKLHLSAEMVFVLRVEGWILGRILNFEQRGLAEQYRIVVLSDDDGDDDNSISVVDISCAHPSG